MFITMRHFFLTLILFGISIIHSNHAFFSTPIQISNQRVESSDFEPDSPVILIPGIGGSKLQAKLEKQSISNFLCPKETRNYVDIWGNLFWFLPGVIDCWIDNVKLTYDNITRVAKSAPGVEFRFPNMKSAESLEWTSLRGQKISFKTIVNALVEQGYSPGENLFGAPYDFRKGPKENSAWFKELKELTEYAYNNNNSTGVTFIAHSMGGRMLLYFLQETPQTWKDKYVKRVISLGAPWGGSIISLQAISVGQSPIFLISNNKLKQAEETFSSIAWLLPSEGYWDPNELLAIVERTEYTFENIDKFFIDMGLPNVVEMRKDQIPYTNPTAPGVEIHCLYGTQIDTPEKMKFGDKDETSVLFINGSGDGYVNLRSLRGCERWINTKAQGQHPIHIHEFDELEHVGMLHSSTIYQYILKQLNKKLKTSI